MIRDFQKVLNRIHVVLDAVVVAAAYFFAWFLMVSTREGGVLPAGIYFQALFIIVPVHLLLNAVFGLYAPKRGRGRRKEFGNILKVNTLSFFGFALVLFLGSKNIYLYHFSRRLVICFYGFSILFETIERNVIRTVLRRIRKKGFNQKEVLLIGFSDAAKGYIDRVLTNPEWGYKIRGILDDSTERDTEYHGVKVIGPVSYLGEILNNKVLDEIAITLPLKEYEKLKNIVSICEKSGVHTKFIPDYSGVIPTIPYMEDMAGLPVINIRHVPLTEIYNAALKRGMDIIFGLTGLIVFAPLMLVTMIAIKVSSPGPVFYAQERIGLHQKPFKMYKFRSMRIQTEEKEKKEWTTKHDPRVTPIGRIIRKTSIDEMPQFWNILKGDMSLIGPRPERPFFVEKFKEEIPHYMIKHQVRPGLTGWAQVNGLRGDTSIEKRIEYDLYYIENWTIGFDFKIIVLTFIKGFVNQNAY